MLPRKRERFFTPNERSSSLSFSNAIFCSSVMIEYARCFVSTGVSGGSLSGMTSPSMRRSGGAPAVMCLSLAPFSTIALRSWWRLTLFSPGWVIVSTLSSISHRNAEDLVGRGDAVEHLEDAGHSEAHHALLDRGELE